MHFSTRHDNNTSQNSKHRLSQSKLSKFPPTNSLSSLENVSSTEPIQFEEVDLGDTDSSYAEDTFYTKKTGTKSSDSIDEINSSACQHGGDRKSKTRNKHGSLNPMIVIEKALFAETDSSADNVTSYNDEGRKYLEVPVKRNIKQRRTVSAPGSYAENRHSRATSPSEILRYKAHISLDRSDRPKESVAVRSRCTSSHYVRKTVKQLEAEYTDSDEEVPDDAIIWNVPLSPQFNHSFSTANNSTSTAEIDKSHRSKSLLQRSRSLGIDESGPSTAFPYVGDISTSHKPIEFITHDKQTSKSWTAAMSNLSTETKLLTQRLEALESNTRGEQERQAKSTKSSTYINFLDKSAKISSIELPPVQRGDITMNPLPISKEKDHFLTRTRPSWLPPKDPKEEQKHLKEYKRMMLKSVEVGMSLKLPKNALSVLRFKFKNRPERFWSYKFD